MHAADFVALGHFLMNDAAARGHPLHVTRSDGTVAAEAVFVFDGAGKHVSDGFDTAMRMPGKASEIIFGDIVAKIIEQQEGIVVGGAAEAESAAEMDAGSFAGGLGFDEFSHGADGHGGLLPVSDIR